MTEETLSPPAPFEPPAWVRDDLGRPTGKGITVAVVDSGWDRDFPDPRVLPGVGLVDPEDDLAMLRTDDDHDRVGHGTACIHQILRIAPDARVIPVRVFGRELETSPGTLHAGLVWAMEQGVQVINLSLGTTLKWPQRLLYAACEQARQRGIIVVAAGHNSQSWSYPAIFENVIGVAADRFSSAFDYRSTPDDWMEVEAWGVEQPVVWLGGETQVKHGTSFAAPNVAGIIALLLERHPGATLEEVRDLLRRYAVEVKDPLPSAEVSFAPRPGFSFDDVPALEAAYRASLTPRERDREARIERDAVPRLRMNGGLTRAHLLELARWRTPRPNPRIGSNPDRLVEETVRAAFSARDERLRVGTLRVLRGVGWPVASAILHFGGRESYPVLDRRVLWSLGVEHAPRYSFEFWWAYTQACRSLTAEAGVTMRSLDRALFQFARENMPAPPPDPAE